MNSSAKGVHHLDETVKELKGPSREQLIVWNQWAAVALNKFFQNSSAHFYFVTDGKQISITLNWNSNFPQDAMREKKNIAENGGISLALFIMSVIFDYRYLHQTEIGEGVDYGFQKEPRYEGFVITTVRNN
jgi:hypothetical protein